MYGASPGAWLESAISGESIEDVQLRDRHRKLLKQNKRHERLKPIKAVGRAAAGAIDMGVGIAATVAHAKMMQGLIKEHEEQLELQRQIAKNTAENSAEGIRAYLMEENTSILDKAKDGAYVQRTGTQPYEHEATFSPQAQTYDVVRTEEGVDEPEKMHQPGTGAKKNNIRYENDSPGF